MMVLRGRVINVYHMPATTTKDGLIREPYSKVQIMGAIPLASGGEQMELVDLRTDRGHAFEAAKGRNVECMVRPYAFQAEGGGVIGGVSMLKGVEIKLFDDDWKPSGKLASDSPRSKAS